MGRQFKTLALILCLLFTSSVLAVAGEEGYLSIKLSDDSVEVIPVYEIIFDSDDFTLSDNDEGTVTVGSLGGGGVTDHGALTGLLDDDHTQYQKETDFTQGSVLFRGATVIDQDNANFFWDDTNNRFGLGINSSLTAQFNMVPPAADEVVFLIDHTVTPYTGTAAYIAFKIESEIETAGSSSDLNTSAMQFDVTNKHAITGTPTVSSNRTTGLDVNATGDADHTGSPSLFFDNSIKGGFFKGASSDTFTGTLGGTTQIGIDAFAHTPGLIFNNAGGTFTSTSIGVDTTVRNSATLTAGSLTANSYGIRLNVIGTTTGTSTVKALNITQASGADTNWAIYSEVDTDSWHRGKFAIGGTAEVTPTAMLDVVADGATLVGMIIKGAGSQSANLTQWQDSADAIGALVNSNRDFSRPNGTNSEQFGAGASASGDDSVAIGKSASAGVDDSVAIGSAAGNFGGGIGGQIAIGKSAQSSGNNTVVIGASASNALGDTIVIGAGSSSNAAKSIVIGRGASLLSTFANTFVSGSGDYPMNNVFFGKGSIHATPTVYTINGTGGSGTDKAGGDISIAGGKGTGNATPGKLFLQTSTVGASGTTLQTLSTRMTIEGANVGIGTEAGIDSLFEVDGPEGLAIETVTGNTTLDNTHSTVLVNCSGSCTMTLPTSASSYNNTDGIGRIYEVKKIDADADTVTIDPDGSELIEFALTAVLTVQGEAITFQTNGTGWFII